MKGKTETKSGYETELPSIYDGLMGELEKQQAAEIIKLKNENKKAKFATLKEKCAFYAMALFAPVIVTGFNLFDKAKDRGLAQFAENPANFLNVNQAIVLHQGLALIMVLFGMRLLVLLLMAIPEFVIFEVMPRAKPHKLPMRIKRVASDGLHSLEIKARAARYALLSHKNQH